MPSDDLERTIGDLTIRVDRDLCVGFGHCLEEAVDAFDLGDDGIVRFAHPERASRDDLLAACQVCPVEALVALDADGEQIVP
jgi:ferredoxin